MNSMNTQMLMNSIKIMEAFKLSNEGYLEPHDQHVVDVTLKYFQRMMESMERSNVRQLDKIVEHFSEAVTYEANKPSHTGQTTLLLMAEGISCEVVLNDINSELIDEDELLVHINASKIK